MNRHVQCTEGSGFTRGVRPSGSMPRSLADEEGEPMTDSELNSCRRQLLALKKRLGGDLTELEEAALLRCIVFTPEGLQLVAGG